MPMRTARKRQHAVTDWSSLSPSLDSTAEASTAESETPSLRLRSKTWDHKDSFGFIDDHDTSDDDTSELEVPVDRQVSVPCLRRVNSHECAAKAEHQLDSSQTCATGSRKRRPRLYAKSFDPSDWIGLDSEYLLEEDLSPRRKSAPEPPIRCRLGSGADRQVRFEMPEFLPEYSPHKTKDQPQVDGLGYESETEQSMFEDSDSDEFESEASISKGRCHSCLRSWRGFGNVCAECRSYGRRISASTCTACGAFFNGFGDTCEDCRPIRKAVRARAQTDALINTVGELPCGYLGAGTVRGRAASQM